ncbi:hypothetical protein DQ04_01781050 [Trypanosoma grayi]|uniref:hypothetical protein n=1 Tax=Trypanosoma grayi TaxID=71804 RepID=UPI0004F45418|nr:hypothetical protein DQ04_01781050 [Trypanosoma grayi]KEG12341.1 hypothetical protein DQ04_01781050 [Trypanosoma grayi]
MLRASAPVTPRHERDRPVRLLTDDELRKEFVHLRKTNATLSEESSSLQAEIGALCEESVRFQQSTEIEEEKLANQLLRRLQSEEQQRRRFRILIRREELSRHKIMDQISQVRGQKTELESQLAQEQESLMRQLQKKLVEVVNKKAEVERELLKERRSYLDVLAMKLASLKQCSFDATGDAAANFDEGSAAAGEPKLSPHEAASGVVSSPTATHEAVIRLERQLNDLLREHAVAVQASAKNEALCAKLGESLEGIQQAAFLDRARASKLKEDLRQARRRLLSMEHQMRRRGPSVASDDSSGLQTPTYTCLKNLSSLRDHTKEVLSAHQRQASSSLHPSCDVSDMGEEIRSSSSMLCSPSVNFTTRTTASDESGAVLLTVERLAPTTATAQEQEMMKESGVKGS